MTRFVDTVVAQPVDEEAREIEGVFVRSVAQESKFELDDNCLVGDLEGDCFGINIMTID